MSGTNGTYYLKKRFQGFQVRYIIDKLDKMRQTSFVSSMMNEASTGADLSSLSYSTTELYFSLYLKTQEGFTTMN